MVNIVEYDPATRSVSFTLKCGHGYSATFGFESECPRVLLLEGRLTFEKGTIVDPPIVAIRPDQCGAAVCAKCGRRYVLDLFVGQQ